ncbi:MAG: hypothetical protein J6T67_03705 [Paludibacteraceae bacterium]|nr:hypothetical protein [Paludibacteraceae bacterium]MBP5481266.1 hypothetical protein [Paludibacteraceae bacterium]MBR5373414.1 hypothetical protein [Paludibacteraceae bacterium]
MTRGRSRKAVGGNPKNPFRFNTNSKKSSGGKRIGKSKPEKANNMLNRRVK